MEGSTSASPEALHAGKAEPARPDELPDLAPGYRDLELPGFQPALFYVPAASTEPLPLVVVMHGAGGRPEPHCERWRHLTGGQAFLLCPRGAPWGHVAPGQEPDGFFFPDHHVLGREVLAAIAAAIGVAGPRLDLEGALFAGYSQGAGMGALFLHDLARRPSGAVRFTRVALVEGGAAEWNVALSEALRRYGVRRVLLACGQRSCERDATRSVPWMRRGGLEVRFENARGAGHTWGGAVGERVESAIPWLLEDEASP